MNERRRQRSTFTSEALNLQLDACCRDGEIEAMVISDDEGLTLAACGDLAACEEIAAHTAHVGRRVAEFSGTLLGQGQHWDVQMKRIHVEGGELLVCAVGGTSAMRQRQVERSASGARRILQA
ncbi:MAG: hypothetical protein R3B48_23095 [Kofleriaceae bacterium]